MANVQGPFGLRPVRRIDGAQPNYQANPYQIAYNNSNKIAKGDPVKLLTSGLIDVLAPGTTAIFGIFWGCQYFDPVQGRTVWSNMWNAVSGLASTQIVTCWVYDDPNIVFEAQAGGSTTPIAQADIGANINFAQQSTPNTIGISTAYLDQTTINTTNTLPFRLVGLSQKVGNDNTSAYNVAEVVFNNAQIKNTTGV